MKMSLLEAANCDTRDSLLLESELELFRRGGWQGGKGPDFVTLQIRKAGRAEEHAIKLGEGCFPPLLQTFYLQPRPMKLGKLIACIMFYKV